MFITATETNNVRVTISSVCEAYRLSVAVCRPYLMRALRDSWVTLIWATATAYALGMVARDVWEWGRPQVMRLIDEFVEARLDNGTRPADDISGTEHPDNPRVTGVAKPNQSAINPCLQSAPTRNMDSAPRTCRPTLVQLRKLAIGAGIRGAGRMNLSQLAQCGYTQ